MMDDTEKRLAELQALFDERGYHLIDEEYEILFLLSGFPAHAEPVDPAYAETYRGRLPDILLRMWVEHGWGSWQRGRFWTCDPALIGPVIEAVFKGDPEYDPAHMVGFAYDCFGALYVWRGERRVMRINWLFNSINENQDDSWNEYGNVPVTDNETILMSLETTPPHPTFDAAWPWADEQGRDMHLLAVARLGELTQGEIYGFVPALALGGENRVETLQKLPIVAHLMFLLSLQRPIIHRYEEPAEGQGGFGDVIPIRPAGPARE